MPYETRFNYIILAIYGLLTQYSYGLSPVILSECNLLLFYYLTFFTHCNILHDHSKFCHIFIIFVVKNSQFFKFTICHSVPGDGGSRLEAKLNKTSVVHYMCGKISNEYFNIWLNLELLVPLVIDCWVDNTRLEYDNVTRTTKNPSGMYFLSTIIILSSLKKPMF